jgi:hypothetical protein
MQASAASSWPRSCVPMPTPTARRNIAAGSTGDVMQDAADRCRHACASRTLRRGAIEVRAGVELDLLKTFEVDRLHQWWVRGDSCRRLADYAGS